MKLRTICMSMFISFLSACISTTAEKTLETKPAKEAKQTTPITKQVASSLPAKIGVDSPKWYKEHMEFMTRDGGVWITDNSSYQNENEPFDSYGLEWKWGLGKQSLTGRLFGIKDGKDIGTFWQFREHWHPDEQKVYAQQFGSNGAYGVGFMNRINENTTRSDQVFFAPTVASSRTGHESARKSENELAIQSYKILEDGTWKKNRFYLWKRSKTPVPGVSKS